MEKERMVDKEFLERQLKRFPGAQIPEDWESMTRPDLFRMLSTN